MCGIVGAIAQRDVGKILLEGLRRLEYRGYDSAGIAIVDRENNLHRLRTKGKVAALCEMFEKNPLPGNLGIAHTRWATHGVPSERNAHPHQSGEDIALVHNGIIENYEELRQELTEKGYKFYSDTDTETIAHLIHSELQSTGDFLAAVKATAKKLHGAYALAIIDRRAPDHLIAVRCGSPLVLGLGFEENFLASDMLALLPVTQEFIFLEEGDIADIQREKITIYDKQGEIVERKVHKSELSHDAVDRGEFRHYMLKEIFEQADALQATLEGRISKDKVLAEAFGYEAVEIFPKVEHIQIVACGTSYNAGLVARSWLEEIARVPCQVEIASEFRYRNTMVPANSLFVTISQSGETADTLAALRKAKDIGYLATLTICNVPESSIVRESDLIFLTRAGREIGVASTKAFTTQLLALLLLTIIFVGKKDKKQQEKMVKLVRQLPGNIIETLGLNEKIKQLADSFVDKHNALFLGRGTEYPIAMEGALKLKEISYIHAEAYPAGELKHGPLALVDKDMPVIAIAPSNDLLEKVKSNLQEVHARGGQLIIFTDKKSGIKPGEDTITIILSAVDPLIVPIVYAIPLQLLAYYVALIKGTDVDQPRNLAKSVTVE